MIRQNLKNPLVSVIIPVFNQKEAYLRCCIESILNQDYPNFELIVSDNYSNNGSWDVINSYIDCRLKIIRPPHHLPMVQHWAFAAFNANGEYLSIMGSDDWAEPTWLSVMISNICLYPAASFAYPNIMLEFQKTGVKHIARDSHIPTHLITSTEAVQLVVKWTDPLFSWWVVGAIVRSKDYFSVCGIARYATIHNGDYPLSLGLLTKGDVVYVNQALANYRVWGEEEGKSEGKRKVILIEDMVKIITCIRMDQPVRLLLAKSGWSITRVRLRLIWLAFIWTAAGLDKSNLSATEKKRIANGFSSLLSLNILPAILISLLLMLIKLFYSPLKLISKKLF